MKRLQLCLLLCLAVLAVHADVDAEYEFEGTLGNSIPVKISFCVNGDDIAVGEIYYPKAKHPAPILIVGQALENGYVFNEYQDDGTITGHLYLRIGEDGGRPCMEEGSWTNPKTGKEFLLRNMVCTSTSVNVPKYLDYEDPQNIGREYAYQIWNPGYGAMMGGTVTFRGAGKNKIHFEVSNAHPNIAEGKSAPNRPAVLGEATHDYFYYDNVNECGYGFAAFFFKRFVVLRTTTGPETLNCFGANTAFDGVYIKIKQ